MEELMIISDILPSKEERHYVVVLIDDEITKPELTISKNIIVKGNLRLIAGSYDEAESYVKNRYFELNGKRRKKLCKKRIKTI